MGLYVIILVWAYVYYRANCKMSGHKWTYIKSNNVSEELNKLNGKNTFQDFGLKSDLYICSKCGKSERKLKIE